MLTTYSLSTFLLSFIHYVSSLFTFKTGSSKRSPNPMYCTSEAGEGWKFQNSCYHLVAEMKPWHNAEEYCKDIYNGHLVSILDTLEDLFLDYILDNIRTDLWIGIKIQVSYFATFYL